MNRIAFTILAFTLNILSVGQLLFKVHIWRTPPASKDPHYKFLDREFYLALGNNSWFTLKIIREGQRVWDSRMSCYLWHKTNKKQVNITMGRSSNRYEKLISQKVKQH